MINLTRILLKMLVFSGLIFVAPGQALEEESKSSLVVTGGSPGSKNYAPDRRADILHLILDITPDFKKRSISGKARHFLEKSSLTGITL